MIYLVHKIYNSASIREDKTCVIQSIKLERIMLALFIIYKRLYKTRKLSDNLTFFV